MCGACENVILLARKIDIEQLVSFRGRGGPFLGHNRTHFSTAFSNVAKAWRAKCRAVLLCGVGCGWSDCKRSVCAAGRQRERKIDIVMSLMLIVRPRGPGAGRLPMPWRLRPRALLPRRRLLRQGLALAPFRRLPSFFLFKFIQSARKNVKRLCVPGVVALQHFTSA
jgi:hypothetical protein